MRRLSTTLRRVVLWLGQCFAEEVTQTDCSWRVHEPVAATSGTDCKIRICTRPGCRDGRRSRYSGDLRVARMEPEKQYHEDQLEDAGRETTHAEMKRQLRGVDGKASFPVQSKSDIAATDEGCWRGEDNIFACESKSK